MKKVAVSNINTIINNDIQKVWNIVLAVDKTTYGEVIFLNRNNKMTNNSIEYTKMDMKFTITVVEPGNAGNLIWRIANMKRSLGVFYRQGMKHK